MRENVEVISLCLAKTSLIIRKNILLSQWKIEKIINSNFVMIKELCLLNYKKMQLDIRKKILKTVLVVQ